MKWTGKTCCRNPNGPGSVTIEVGNARELAAVEASLSGACWIRGDEHGNLVRQDRFSTPAVEDDPAVDPHFTRTTQGSFWPYRKTKVRQWSQPAIYVQHISGYNGKYEVAARAMESCGFECMRSRRGENGQYWEVWYLPGPYRARGPIEGMKSSEEIAQWVMSNVCPGQIELGGSCWGLCIE